MGKRIILFLLFLLLSCFKNWGQTVNTQTCSISTINNNFDQPVLQRGVVGASFINDNNVTGWKTTANDNMIEFWNVVNNENVVPFDGPFIELNAFQVAGVYQDYDSPDGFIFYFTFAHRGRWGTDVCEVKAGPPGGPYVQIMTASDGNITWGVHEGSYVIPLGQTKTRFIFESVSAAGNDQTVGNFLDAINFEAMLSLPKVKIDNNSICYGGSVVLQASGTYGATFSWYDSNGVLVKNGAEFTTPLLFADTKYYVTQSSNGCTSEKKEIIISVPLDNTLIVTSPSKVCFSQTADLTEDAVTAGSKGNGVLSYWADLAGTVPLTNPQAVKSGTYYIKKGTGNCADIKPVVISEDFLQELVITNPVEVCFSQTVNLTDTSITVGSKGDGILSYWEDLGGSIPLSNPQAVKSGTYYIKKGTGNCADIKQVVINEKTKIFDIKINVGNQTICSGEMSSISLSSAVPGTTFNWVVFQTKATGAVNGQGSRINQILYATEKIRGKLEYIITPSLNGCSGDPVTVTIYVNPIPFPTLSDANICIDKSTNAVVKGVLLDSGLSDSDYDFEWFLNDVSLPIKGKNQGKFMVMKDGNYGVKAINKVTGCASKIITAKIGILNPISLERLKVKQDNLFEDNLRVEVTLDDTQEELEYRLDVGAFQNSSVFNNVKQGEHVVTVRQVNGCAELSKDIFVIGYPKFFTPNGDGYNDVWNLTGVEEGFNYTIFIYDRYGKLVKRGSSMNKNSGWDGTYNGHSLPSSDYWFSIEYKDVKGNTGVFKSHFALKR